MSDLQINHLSFDTKGFMSLFLAIVNTHLDTLSQYLKNLVMGEIWLNGNGSAIMKLTACAHVKETNRVVTSDMIELDVGIDMDGLPENIYVRISVVLHGNQGSGPLYEKPGVATWNKHVIAKGIPDPDRRNADNALPAGFNQTDKMKDIEKGISENIEHRANKYVNDFLRALEADLSRVDWSSFLIVG